MIHEEQLRHAMILLEMGDFEDKLNALPIITEARHLPAVPHLIAWLPNADPGTRYLIVKALVNLPHDDAVPVLLEALRWDDMWTRAAITGALIANGSALVIDGLIDALSDENAAVRRASAKALGKIEVQVASETYHSVIRGLSVALLDMDNGVRRFAAEALGRLNAASKIPELTHALDDIHASVRIAAFRALTTLDTPEAQSAVRKWATEQ